MMVDLPATFTAGVARSAGVAPRELYRARDAGEVVELSRGVFRRADAPSASYPDLLAVAYRAPRAVVCLLSAAVVHELTDEVPLAVQLAVPRGTWPPRIAHPPVEVFVFHPGTFELGLSTVEAAPGERVRVYSSVRTVVDLWRLRARLGESVAQIALRRYLASRQARVAELVDLAGRLGVLGPVRSAVDVLTAS
ncbi:MAG: type IV toxin-antitoxin system AbiEi family antitoxin domain-containing protein [Angustibacter sp.]